ncbi:MAG: class I SAM-dependent rRNA methyltransferase [Myxococcota bacterium]|jgi:23S rRNA (cytosine1962-C5)-methyltransferase|nr:class I SAM-dependent rRNA methyltransferase [Myxococcota bacterium]
MRLAAGVSDRLRRGHPWVYSSKLAFEAEQPSRIVELRDPRNRPIGHALFDPTSAIALRLISRPAEPPPGPELWLDRFRRALRLRRQLFDDKRTNAYRLCNGEGDGLPGVVVDRYADHLVLKLDTAAWLPYLDELCVALRQTLPVAHGWFRGVRGRSKAGNDSLQAEARPLWGKPPEQTVEVLENGMRLLADLRRGQKTGLFLDQRDNRWLLRSLSTGLRVLNLFSYTAAFSLAAALGGARRTCSVDIAAAALELAKQSFLLNGVAPERHDFIAADVFDYLAQTREEAPFDLVIVDPPSMAPNQAALPNAKRAYVSLNAAALGRVEPRGLLASASCSSHVDRALFLELLGESARVAKRRLTLLELREQPADHPSLLAFPEGRYLQFALFRVE